MNPAALTLAVLVLSSTSLIAGSAEPLERCNGDADIVFVVDASGSIGSSNFQTVLSFIINVTTYFSDDALSRIRFGLVTFSDAANISFDLDTFNDSESLTQAIASVPYNRGNTRTDKGLDKARNMFRENGRPHVIILVTDGQSSSRESTKTAANRLRETKIITLCIGVTDSINEEELRYIGGPNDILTVNTFDSLQGILKGLFRKTCQSIGGAQIQVNDAASNSSNGNKTCYGLADVIFVVDGSGSIGAGNFKVVLNFIRRLTVMFSTGGVMNFGIGMVTFSENATKIVDPYTFNDTESLDKIIANAHYPARSTRTDLGLNLARSMFLDNGRSHVIILLTDGLSSNRVKTRLAADVLRANNITTLSVGITESINRKELEYISRRANIFTVVDFTQLLNVLEGLVEKTCESILEKDNSATLTTSRSDTTTTRQDTTTRSPTPDTTQTTTTQDTTPGSPTPDTTQTTTTQDTTPGSPTPDTTPTTTRQDTTASLFTWPTETPNIFCPGKADIVFVVDASGSIGKANYEIFLSFVRNITAFLTNGVPGDVRFGMVVYSENVTQVFNLNTFNAIQEIQKAIVTAPYFASSTRTDKGLDLAREMLISEGRDNTTLLVILLTDGISTARDQTKLAAQRLRDDNITALSIGVTDAVNLFELNQISLPGNVFFVGEFNLLRNVLYQLTKQTCEIVAVGPSVTHPDVLQTTSDVTKNPGIEATTAFCPGKADIVFVVDASGSIGEANFEIVLSFVTNITAVLTSGVPSDVRFGMVVYSERVAQVFNLNTFDDIQEIQKAIATAPYFASSTRTDKGLDLAREMLISEGRTNASLLVILLTDGISTARDKTKLAAQRLRDNNIAALSIGVTDAINPYELNEISLPGNVFLVGEFYMLRNVLIQLARQTCEIVIVGPSVIQPDVPETTQPDVPETTQPHVPETTLPDVPKTPQRDVPETTQPNVPETTQADVPETTVISTTTQNSTAVISALVNSSTVTLTPETTVVSAVDSSSTAAAPMTLCNASADVVFVLDASGSIGDVQYRMVLSFVKNYINSSISESSSDLRFGLVIFSDDVQKILELDSYNDIQELNEAIDGAPYPGGFTYTDKGLNMARQMFLLHGRATSSHVIILMTDGYSTSRNETLLEAQVLRVNNITAISIGLGDIIDESELNEISEPGDVIMVHDYNKLRDFLGQLFKKFCHITVTPVINTKTPETTVVTTKTPSSTASPQITQCNSSADVVFVLDASGSIGDVQYRMVLSFVKNFINSSTSGSSSDHRFGLVIFSDDVQKISELNTYNDIQELNKALDDAPYPGGFTYTDKGLNMARQMFLRHGRATFPHVIILMTGGYSTSRNETLLEAQGLRVSNITTLSIGLGDIIDKAELNEISKPGDVFVVNDYNKLTGFLGQLLNKFCQTVSSLQISTRKPECKVKADIVFITDSSGSIGLKNYKKVLNFAVNFTANFIIGRDDVLVGHVIFGHEAKKMFDFKDYSNHVQLREALLSTPYLLQSTNTDKALDLVASGGMLDPSSGARPDARKIAIVITDGRSDKPEFTNAAAKRLREKGVTIIAIGIVNALTAEIKAMASTKRDAFELTSFDSLEAIVKQVLSRICSNPSCEARNF